MEAKRFPEARCPACGGTCAYVPEKGTSVCSACGREAQIPFSPCAKTEAHSAEELAGDGSPDVFGGIVPPKIGRSEAAERMRKSIAKKLLCPPAYRDGIPEGIASLSVVLLQWWKRNSLISILFGTVIYMLLIQLVF